MKLLADESVDMAMIRALRDAGHDVLAIAETQPGAADEDVAELARAGERLLLTEDRDFGRLVFALNQPSGGILYLRYPAVSRLGFAQEVADFIDREGADLNQAFSVLQPGRSRISRLPRTEGG